MNEEDEKRVKGIANSRAYVAFILATLLLMVVALCVADITSKLESRIEALEQKK